MKKQWASKIIQRKNGENILKFDLETAFECVRILLIFEEEECKENDM
jgi:hypothetical protein